MFFWSDGMWILSLSWNEFENLLRCNKWSSVQLKKKGQVSVMVKELNGKEFDKIHRAWRKNCSIQEAFRHCLRRKKSLETDVFYYRGDEYKNLKECREKYNINVQSVHSYRFRNKDSDYDEAIDYIRKITKKRQRREYLCRKRQNIILREL